MTLVYMVMFANSWTKISSLLSTWFWELRTYTLCKKNQILINMKKEFSHIFWFWIRVFLNLFWKIWQTSKLIWTHQVKILDDPVIIDKEKHIVNKFRYLLTILLYGCTTWTLTKRLEKKLDGNYTRMLRAILNRSWRQHPTKQQLFGQHPPIAKTIQIRRTRHAGDCWRSRDELISDVLL